MHKNSCQLKVGIITASDRSWLGKREDKSGLILKPLLEELPSEVVAYEVLPDDEEALRQKLCYFADTILCDLIVTTGGTGLSPRDCTPEATRQAIQKEIPGVSEAIRQASLGKTPWSMLSRGIAGVRGKSLMINFPGSPDAVQEAFEVVRPVLFHAIRLIQGKVRDCQTEERWGSREEREKVWNGPSRILFRSLS